MKRKSARSVKKPERRKEAALPYNRKDPRQLKLMLTPSDELERATKEERRCHAG
jgi:hypothetical protein